MFFKAFSFCPDTDQYLRHTLVLRLQLLLLRMHILTLKIHFLGPLIELKPKLCVSMQCCLELIISNNIDVVFNHEFQLSTGCLCYNRKMNKYMHDENQVAYHSYFQHKNGVNL